MCKETLRHSRFAPGLAAMGSSSNMVTGADHCHSISGYDSTRCVAALKIQSTFDESCFRYASEKSKIHQSGGAFLILFPSVAFQVGETLVCEI